MVYYPPEEAKMVSVINTSRISTNVGTEGAVLIPNGGGAILPRTNTELKTRP